MRMAWPALVWLCVHMVGFARPLRAAEDMPPDVLVIPTPREITAQTGWVYTASVDLVVTGSIEAVQAAADDLAQDLAALAGTSALIRTVGSLGAATAEVVVVLGVTFSVPGHGVPAPPDKPEGYVIHPVIQNGRWFMHLNGRDARGTLWATKTLKQLARRSAGGIEFLPCDVTDWPWYPLRSTSINYHDEETTWGAVDYKINAPYFSWWSLGTAWRDPPAWYRDTIASLTRQLADRGLDMLHIIHPYWVADNDPPYLMSIRATNGDDFDKLMDAYRLSLTNGNGIVCLAFDDGAQLVPPEDLALFGTYEQVHAEVFRRFSTDLSTGYPNAELVFLPRHYYGVPLPYMDAFTNMPADTILKWTGPSGTAVSLEYSDADLDVYRAAIGGRRFIIHDNTPYQRYGLQRGWALFDSYADGYGNLYQHCHGIKATYNFRPHDPVLLAHGMVIAEYMWNADRYDAETAVARSMAKVGGWPAVPHLQAFKTNYIALASWYPVEKIPHGLTEELLDQYTVSAERFEQDRAVLQAVGQALEDVADTCANGDLVTELGNRYADLVYLFDLLEPRVYTIVRSDLRVYWRLDGDLEDSAGAADGWLVNDDGGGIDVGYVAGFNGVAGGALEFSGTTDFMATPYVTHTGPKSLSLFFTTRQNTAAECFAGSHGDQRFYIGAHHPMGYAGSVLAVVGGTTETPRPETDFVPTGTPVSADNAWHHCVLTDDGAGNLTIYYRSPSDSQHLAYSAAYTGTSGGAGIFEIGRIGGGGFPASGTVDDVAVFNRVLTQAEVEGIFVAGSVDAAVLGPGATFSPDELHAYWTLDGDLDDSAGANDGSFVDRDGGGNNIVYATGFDGTGGSALDFGGTTDHVTTPYVPHTGPKSVSLFFTTRQNTTAELMGGCGGDNRFYFAAHHLAGLGGSLLCALGLTARFPRPDTDFVPPGTPVVPDNSWNHYVLTDDGAGKAVLYYRSPYDTQHLVYTTTYDGTSGGIDVFTIGAFPDGAWPASGMIDDVAVFNRALTQGEVESIYDGGSVARLIVPGDGSLLLIE